MAIKLGQQLKQTQQLTMTPQLQQAIKLLTLTHLEMTNVIASEMVENPVLEESGLDSSGEELQEVDQKLEKLEGEISEAKSNEFGEDQFSKKEDDFDWQQYVSSFNTDSSSSPPSMVSKDPDEMPNYENMVSQNMSLAEHLEWQLRMQNLREDEWEFSQEVIHNINDDGYLDLSFDEILSSSQLEREDALEILEMIKNLDPVGCGSSSLKECLLAQAKLLEQRLPLVEKIISTELDLLEVKNFSQISKNLSVGEEAVQGACELIQSFNPKPGRLISSDETHYVVPDIFVVDVGGNLEIRVNDDGVPRLRISQLYKKMLTGQQSNKETKDFIQDKLRSAMWLIKSIHNRQKTIYKVADAIIRHQVDFFKKGPEAMRPMILKDIALEIGVHESTVSRVTTNKYMHTPLGTYELRYFFNTGIGGKSGGIDIAGESLKVKIKSLIDSESPKKPLSDQKLVELLKKDGIEVARRTIAKYRDMMNIPSSSKRKGQKR